MGVAMLKGLRLKMAAFTEALCVNRYSYKTLTTLPLCVGCMFRAVLQYKCVVLRAARRYITLL